MKGVFTGVAMMVFLHGYMGYTQPLFIQALMGLKGLYDSNEIKIHILGTPAIGDLKRPFKSAPGLFGRKFYWPLPCRRRGTEPLSPFAFSHWTSDRRRCHQGGRDCREAWQEGRVDGMGHLYSVWLCIIYRRRTPSPQDMLLLRE